MLFSETEEKFENTALRSGPSSTVIRHENEASRNCSSNRLFVFVWTENILKTKLFENDGVTIIILLGSLRNHDGNGNGNVTEQEN